jgi:hypothetical protein
MKNGFVASLVCLLIFTTSQAIAADLRFDMPNGPSFDAWDIILVARSDRPKPPKKPKKLNPDIRISPNGPPVVQLTEPDALLLVGFGLVGLAWLRRRTLK